MRICSIALVWCLAACTLTGAQSKREPVIGGPCEGCEWVFEGMPAKLGWTSRIGAPDEPGTPMRIDGVVRDRSGKPAAGIIVYAYQTDAGGLYPTGANRHGRLKGWARTDANGRYRFDTIRPGGYPNTNIPQHVHMHVIEPGRATYYIDDIVFSDDPRLTPEQRRSHVTGRGGNGLVTPRRDADGRLLVTRDIVLRQGIDAPAHDTMSR